MDSFVKFKTYLTTFEQLFVALPSSYLLILFLCHVISFHNLPPAVRYPPLPVLFCFNRDIIIAHLHTANILPNIHTSWLLTLLKISTVLYFSWTCNLVAYTCVTDGLFQSCLSR